MQDLIFNNHIMPEFFSLNDIKELKSGAVIQVVFKQ
jgi:hypothetical protein